MNGTANPIATSPLGSDFLRPFVLIANPESPRVELLQAARRRLDLAPAHILPYLHFLHGKPQILANALIKLDSPGRNFAVETRLLHLGVGHPALAGFASAMPGELAELPFRKGEILWPRQWYAGFCRLLDRLDVALALAHPHRLIGHPPDIRLFFDKARCHAHLAAHGIPVAPALCPPENPIRSHAELIDRMTASRISRIFLKLAHGSSASGVVAFQFHGNQQRATTTVEMQPSDGALRLFNSRRIRTCTDPADIRLLIDELCRHCVHVEQWIPKAGIDGRTFDLRILGIAGKPRHVVVRTSTSPITNLHLLNTRGDLDRLRARAGDAHWQRILDTCTRVLALFPSSFCIGIDLLIRADWRAHAILELNAFGDLLTGVLDRGEDPYTAQLTALCPSPAEVAA